MEPGDGRAGASARTPSPPGTPPCASPPRLVAPVRRRRRHVQRRVGGPGQAVLRLLRRRRPGRLPRLRRRHAPVALVDGRYAALAARHRRVHADLRQRRQARRRLLDHHVRRASEARRSGPRRLARALARAARRQLRVQGPRGGPRAPRRAGGHDRAGGRAGLPGLGRRGRGRLQAPHLPRLRGGHGRGPARAARREGHGARRAARGERGARLARLEAALLGK